ncbi:MAG TPA: hypothetical protein VEK08_11855 [Planctomycetota bacterium]|nr:hypothetical protein [Planctomycetota bacterium]
MAPKIEFSLDNVWLGFGTLHGLARLESDAIVFEVQTQDNVFNVVKSPVSEIRLSFSDIEKASFSNGFFGFFASLTITGHSLAAMQNIPGAKQRSLTVDIARKARPEAREFVSQINLIISEQMLKRELNMPAAEMLPSQSSLHREDDRQRVH